jgi:CrcB protein
MTSILFVGVGGCLGSVLRYLLGRIFTVGEFPFTTMAVNFLGAFVIGFTSELAKEENLLRPNAVLFLQTGLCGGFTTFSTFSLETMTLFRNDKYFLGLSYVSSSVALCLIGVGIGAFLARIFKTKITG